MKSKQRLKMIQNDTKEWYEPIKLLLLKSISIAKLLEGLYIKSCGKMSKSEIE